MARWQPDIPETVCLGFIPAFQVAVHLGRELVVDGNMPKCFIQREADGRLETTCRPACNPKRRHDREDRGSPARSWRPCCRGALPVGGRCPCGSRCRSCSPGARKARGASTARLLWRVKSMDSNGGSCGIRASRSPSGAPTRARRARGAWPRNFSRVLMVPKILPQTSFEACILRAILSVQFVRHVAVRAGRAHARAVGEVDRRLAAPG